ALNVVLPDTAVVCQPDGNRVEGAGVDTAAGHRARRGLEQVCVHVVLGDEVPIRRHRPVREEQYSGTGDGLRSVDVAGDEVVLDSGGGAATNLHAILSDQRGWPDSENAVGEDEPARPRERHNDA